MDDRLRALWLDLAERYQWLYHLTLQERLGEMRQDVGDWWWVGGLKVPNPAGPTQGGAPRAGPSHASVASNGPRRSSPPRALVSLLDAEPDDERPLSGLPDGVKRIILEVAIETGVSPAEIMSKKTTRRIHDARRACAQRLRRLRFGGGRGGGPSQAQIGVWLRRDHSTINRMLGDR